MKKKDHCAGERAELLNGVLHGVINRMSCLIVGQRAAVVSSCWKGWKTSVNVQMVFGSCWESEGSDEVRVGMICCSA